MGLYQKINGISNKARIGIVTGLAALILGCGNPPNYFPIPNNSAPNNKYTKILFCSDMGGNFDIYTINPDGTNLEQITNTPWDEYTSDWSPDGTRIVYQSTEGSNPELQQYVYNIYIINKDGTGKTQLTFEEPYNGIPSWSPNRDKILFVSTRDGNNEIYVMNIDGTNQTRLTDSLSIEVARSWSPDGSKIAFELITDKNDATKKIEIK